MRLVKFVEFGRKIIGIGRNYVDHVKEMKSEMPKAPVIFFKPSTSYIVEGSPIIIPRNCTELHHEIELGVVIGRKGYEIPEKEAEEYIGGYTLALDMTARDWQADAKTKGLPWSISKGFNTSCPVGNFVPKEQVSNVNNLQLWCRVNGTMKQDGNTKDMIFNVPYLISYISQFFTLEVGDLILTGTPAGVGPVVSGDVIEAGLGDLIHIKFNVDKKSII